MIVFSLLIGLITSVTYMKAECKEGISKNFALSLVILPSIVGVIILTIGTNIASAFSLGGAFSLVRFRSAPGNAKDISYIFMGMAAGLACGLGYLGYALVFAFILCIVIYILTVTSFGQNRIQMKELRIFVPEDLNYQDAFDDVMVKYTKKCNLMKIKTADLGSVYELYYNVVLDENVNEKEMIDALRCRNGNLNIILSLMPEGISGFSGV